MYMYMYVTYTHVCIMSYYSPLQPILRHQYLHPRRGRDGGGGSIFHPPGISALDYIAIPKLNILVPLPISRYFFLYHPPPPPPPPPPKNILAMYTCTSIATHLTAAIVYWPHSPTNTASFPVCPSVCLLQMLTVKRMKLSG